MSNVKSPKKMVQNSLYYPPIFPSPHGPNGPMASRPRPPPSLGSDPQPWAAPPRCPRAPRCPAGPPGGPSPETGSGTSGTGTCWRNGRMEWGELRIFMLILSSFKFLFFFGGGWHFMKIPVCFRMFPVFLLMCLFCLQKPQQKWRSYPGYPPAINPETWKKNTSIYERYIIVHKHNIHLKGNYSLTTRNHCWWWILMH